MILHEHDLNDVLAKRAGMLRLNARRCIAGQFFPCYTVICNCRSDEEGNQGLIEFQRLCRARISRIVNYLIVLSGLRLRLQRTAYRENRTPRATHDLLGR